MVETSGTLVRITDKEFERLRDFIYKVCGINLSPPKRILLESRLQRRISTLRFSSFTAYTDYVVSPQGQKEELVFLIDAIATNKTDFFREPIHFQFMQQEILPAAALEVTSRPFKIWSSACSSGEEPYTIAMVMEEFNLQQKLDYKIVATDISTKVLEKAVQAIYQERNIGDIPLPLRKRYLLKSKNPEDTTVRMIPRLRSKVQYKRINLTDPVLEVDADFDLIFCRNVLIYFDRQTQEEVVTKLLSKLRSGGYLFIGHSESIYHMNVPVRQCRPTIFQKE